MITDAQRERRRQHRIMHGVLPALDGHALCIRAHTEHGHNALFPGGLYIKTVNGVTLDYDADGAYWAFYINGEYASTGVDATNIEAGATYTLKGESAAATNEG